MTITLAISLATGLVSFAAFRNNKIAEKLKFNAYLITQHKQWYRIITHAFVHADWAHLLINIMVFISFGNNVEQYFILYFNSKGKIYFLILYFLSIIFSSLYDLVKQKNNYHYNAVGASGAVSAVLYASVFFEPLAKVYFFGILPIPGILFAILYLFYSYYMAKKSNDNIGHYAHFWGAVFGFLFPLFLNPQLFSIFIDKLFNF
jgi:membrane associated rhomboid family serine protease